MSPNTVFEIAKAEQLKASLQSLRECVKQDWQITAAAIKNLQSQWNDNQSIKAEKFLEEIASNYQAIETSLDSQIQSISEQISIAQNRQEKIDALKNKSIKP
jgi:vacuolar-type H+-ATPase subunit I/STV1